MSDCDDVLEAVDYPSEIDTDSDDPDFVLDEYHARKQRRRRGYQIAKTRTVRCQPRRREDCPVCLDELGTWQTIVYCSDITGCGNPFHARCVRSINKCPMCRVRVEKFERVHEEDEEDGEEEDRACMAFLTVSTH